MWDREDTKLMDSNSGLKKVLWAWSEGSKGEMLTALDVPQQLGSTAANLEEESRSGESSETKKKKKVEPSFKHIYLNPNWSNQRKPTETN